MTGRTMRLLRGALGALGDADRARAQEILGAEEAILDRLRVVVERRLSSRRIRVHGDLHLGQLLFTGRDFLVIDFEGEPARPLVERRATRTPLRDIAGMLRSFHYATAASVREQAARGLLQPDSAAEVQVRPWTDRWLEGVSAAFLGGYLNRVGAAPWLSCDDEEIRVLLDLSLLEKALYELSYELNNRPAWVGVALEGLLGLVGDAPDVAVPSGDPGTAAG
jgi:maltose alpha-D-glucosyltransferase / alpha-amylase